MNTTNTGITSNVFSPAQEAVLAELRSGFQGTLSDLAFQVSYAYPTVRRVVQELRALDFSIYSTSEGAYSVTRLVSEPTRTDVQSDMTFSDTLAGFPV